MSIWVTHHRDKKGHLAGRFTEDIVKLLGRSQRAEAARLAVGNHYLNNAEPAGEGRGKGGGTAARGVSVESRRGAVFDELEQAEVAPLYFVPISTWETDMPLDGGWCSNAF